MKNIKAKREPNILKECFKTEIEYTKNLTLKSDNHNFKFNYLLDYWNFQKKYIKDYRVEDNAPIFQDDNTKLLIANPYTKRKCISKGKMAISNRVIQYSNVFHNIENIENATIVSGQKLIYTYCGNDYLIKGDKRFNPVKYVLLFSKLDTKIKLENKEKYFTLEEDKW